MTELDDPDTGPTTGHPDVGALLSDTVTQLDPTAQVTVTDVTVGKLVTLPDLVVRAVIEATAEAVRNSLRHAGPDAHVVVTGSIAAGAVRVTIDDDGPGFDLDAVPPHRLGISHGIQQRMTHAGGSATITSRPRHGTTIELRWPAP